MIRDVHADNWVSVGVCALDEDNFGYLAILPEVLS